MCGEPFRSRLHCLLLRVYPRVCGEPFDVEVVLVPAGVYPRVCGGTVSISVPRSGTGGLSPRVRGNRNSGYCFRCGIEVYPRVCGGTLTARVTLGATRVYPRVAGEPALRLCVSNASKVYPRVCGGTSVILRVNHRLAGLSPRVRGNPTPDTAAPSRNRSIPACAGEP